MVLKETALEAMQYVSRRSNVLPKDNGMWRLGRDDNVHLPNVNIHYI